MRLAVIVVLLGGCAPDSGTVRYAPPGSALVASSGPQTGSDGTTPSGTTPPPGTSTTTPGTTTTPPTTTGDPPWGIDISHWNYVSDWNAVAADHGFAIVKSTEGTYYVDDTFDGSYAAAYDAGMVHGAYHFAIPDDSSGAEQADFFVDHGGGWSADGVTLPGTLDIEWNPNWSDDCYGLSKGEMTDWVADFADEYFALTGREAMIYTSATWWNLCVDSEDFWANPLWVANYGVGAPNIPVGWSDYTIWQTSGYGSVNGVEGDCDIDVFGGSPEELTAFAKAN